MAKAAKTHAAIKAVTFEPTPAPLAPQDIKARREALRITVEKHAISYRKLAMASAVKERLIRLAVENNGALSEAAWQAIAASCPADTPLHQLLAPVISPAPAASLPPAATTAEALSRIIRVPLKMLRENPDNYRKTYDEAAMKELDASILAEGVLQNLVTFPISNDGTYTLNSGNRRFRSLKRLEARGKIDCNYLVHILPKTMTADEALALAIVENLQRQDVDPLEEADGFAQLEKLKWSTERIAEFIGIARRTVQDRLQLSKGLSDDGRTALREKKITIDQARAIVTCPNAAMQKDMIAAATRSYGPLDGPALRQWLKSRLPSVKVAGFDLALYKGDYVGTGKDRLFLDVEAFKKLQRAAAKAQAAELRKTWSKVTLIKEGGYFQSWAYVKETDPTKGEAFVEIDPHKAMKIVVHAGYVPNPARADLDDDDDDDGEASSENEAAAAEARRAHDAALTELIESLGARFAAKPAHLLRLALFEVLTDYNFEFDLDHPMLEFSLSECRAVLERMDLPQATPEMIAAFDGFETEDDRRAVWARLLALPDQWVFETVARAQARSSMRFFNHRPIAPVTKSMIDDLGVEIPAMLLPVETDDEAAAGDEASTNDADPHPQADSAEAERASLTEEV